MSSLNKVMLIGRLGKDPEIRFTPDGSPVANFSLATSELWTDKSGTRQERTEWHNIVAWSKLADLSKRYLAKGRQVYIEGRIRTREWDDKDGNKRRTTEIVANQMVLLGSRPEGMESNAPPPMQRSAPAVEPGLSQASGLADVEITDDDIPF
ncbi:MAG: single-stranded DNA-binding protein [Acidobacteriota bacterium]|jgi:single-strand DNA-binding protein